jgi:hypothetical protein
MFPDTGRYRVYPYSRNPFIVFLYTAVPYRDAEGSFPISAHRRNAK